MLVGLLALALVVQAVLWVESSGLGPWLGVVVALGLGLLCFGLGLRLLKRALLPLSFEAFRLQEMAIGWEAGRALSSPPVHTRDRTLIEIEHMRRRLFEGLHESRRLRKQAEEASRYKTGFLKSVQHELRTPLNAVLGFTEVLLSGLEGPLTAGQRENLVVIGRTGKRLQDLFDEVIELAATAAGQLELRREPLDVATALEQVGEALEEARGDKPVHIRLDLGDDLPLVLGDDERLTRLLHGIASQALSVLQGQLLVLSAHAFGEQVQVAVCDPARKLAPEEVEGLLGSEPTGLRRKGLDEGSRLRLAIWRQLAELFGGTLVLRSDQGGTAFVLELPAWSEA